MDNERLRKALISLNTNRRRLGNKTIIPANTTSIAPNIEYSLYNQKDIERPYNIVLANLANEMDVNSSKIPANEYNKLATVLSEMQKQYGSPTLRNMRYVKPEIKQERPHYSVRENYLGVYSRPKTKEMYDEFNSYSPVSSEWTKYSTRPDIYFQELAHAKQYNKNPLTSLLRGGIDELLYEDSNDPYVGEYSVPGTIENEAHEVIAPQLYQQFKDLYTKRYGKFPEKYENKNISSRVKRAAEKLIERESENLQNNVLKNINNNLFKANTTNVNYQDKVIPSNQIKLANLENRRLRGIIPDRIYNLLIK